MKTKMKMKKRTFISAIFALILALMVCVVPGADEPDQLVLSARYRPAEPEGGGGGGGYHPVFKDLTWKPSETALLVCDMWNEHWCEGATDRVAEMAPRMNEFVSKARERGILIIHAPSSTMEFYKDHPARKRAQSAPKASNPPEEIDKWLRWMSDEEKAEYPIDQEDGGCDCAPKCKTGHPWTRQIETIEIRDEDSITDSGVENWNLLEDRGIKNVMIVGVHTNMCVLGRPFGLRQMARNGKNVVLVRDLTDTMYNSRSRPYVNHFAGNSLIADHIEKFVCPTVTSTALTGKAPFRFRDDTRPRVVFMVAESEYGARVTQPRFARLLRNTYGLHAECLVNTFEGMKGMGRDRHSLRGMATLEGADLVVVFMRRRALSKESMAYFREHLNAGKPLIGVRTASHALDAKGPVPTGEVAVLDGRERPLYLEQWTTFDPEVLGGNYHGHYGRLPEGTLTAVVPGMTEHPILKGVEIEGFVSKGSLYRSSPLSPRARVLLTGSIPNEAPEPVLWTHSYRGSRVVATSLGHPEDYDNEAFRRLMANAVIWALDRPVKVLNEAVGSEN